MLRARSARAAATALLLALASLCLGACGAQDDRPEAEAVTLRLVCECEGVHQVLYSFYIGGERRGMGGMADIDGKALSPDQPLESAIPAALFEAGDDLSLFSIAFSPYGEGDTVEMGTTAPLEFPVSWGGTYTVVLSGDRENGFTAELAS